MRRLIRMSVAFSFLWLMAAAPATSPTSRPVRDPVPAPASQTDALRLIQRLFHEEYRHGASSDMAALSRTLMQESRNTHDNPAGRYMLLIEAARLGSQAGEADLVAEAVALVTAQYDVSRIVLLTEFYPPMTDRVRTVSQLQSLALRSLAAAQQSVADEQFEAVEPFLQIAEKASTSVRRVDLAAKVTTQAADLRAIVAEWKEAQKANNKITARTATPDDMLVFGRFLALRMGQFDKGLPWCARGSDSALAMLAQRDIAGADDPMQQKKIADMWWEYASSHADAGRAVDRARYWYARARDSLTGLTLRDIDARLATGPATRPGVAGVPAETSQITDLLPLVQPLTDAVEGTWSLEEGVLKGEGKIARLQLPVAPPAEYDLEMTFSRDGRGGVVILLAREDRSFNLALDISGTARLELVNKKTRTDNPTLAPLDLEKGKTYTVTAQVRKAAVHVLVDGKHLLSWQTDYQDLTRPSQWKIRDNGNLGVGISSGTLKIEKITLRAVAGEARITRKTGK